MMSALSSLLLVLVGTRLLPHCHCFVPATEKSTRVLALPPLLLAVDQRLPNHEGDGSSTDDDDDDEEEESSSSALRRSLVFLLATPCTLLLPSTNIALANAAETPAEAIRLLTSKTIPGLGPPDIYYPSYFLGSWKVTSVISTSDDNFWNDLKLNGVTLPVTIVSKMRFIPYDAGKSFTENQENNPRNNNVPAIADRAFNEQSYYAALSEELHRLYSTTKPLLPSSQSVTWTPTNPNVLSLSYSNGSSKEIKVTKRSSDVSNDGKSVFSSEFRRITNVPPPPPPPPSSAKSIGVGGIPSISKSRVLTKWKQSTTDADDNINRIEGIEIMYNENGTLGEKDKNADPLMGGRSISSSSSRSGAGSIPLLYGNDTKDLPDWRSTKRKILMEKIID